ncbi:class I SAM-dependent methyltransferase [Sulfurimonas aquatica]|nr:class I SAM-dependent methyltransferase [Sulfurimonas aquatica]
MDLLKKELINLEVKSIIEFKVLNPDYCSSTYAGNRVYVNNQAFIYREYKAWLDLAHILNCRMLTPKSDSGSQVIIRYEKLNSDESFHKSEMDKEKKYGTESIFSQIYKNEEPSFIHYYLQALKNVNFNKRTRVLNLGVNSADEFVVIKEISQDFSTLELVGIDFCDSAIELARKKFINDKNITFYTHHINDLASLNLGEFDLIISIGTLQSSNLEFNKLFMSIVQNQLKRDGAMILGFPNCRWVDGEMVYGAKVKNYPFSEMGLLYKDVVFCKKYLQQKKFRVTVTGKDYIFLTASSIRK